MSSVETARGGRACTRVWLFVVAAGLALALTAPRGLVSSANAQGASVVPAAKCQKDDRPEANDVTGLQGQVPWADRLSGRAADGYSCNLKLTGTYGSEAWATLDSYRNCAYYGDLSSAGGTVVVDVSDPARPQKTGYLTTPAMQAPWESLRVNAKRGLLVADADASQYLDIYDVATDCRHPRLLFSGELDDAVGHEGWFAPDGTIYYMSGADTVTPVDLSDPRKPRVMASWTFPSPVHGGSTSDDGRTAYVCGLNYEGQPDQVYIVDTSEVQERRREPELRVLGSVPLTDNFGCQATYPVTYGGHPYLIQFGELGRGAQAAHIGPVFGDTPANLAVLVNKCPNGTHTNFAAPHIIDLQSLQIVSTLLLQVHDPANCPLVNADNSGPADTADAGKIAVAALFVYDVHHCSPDRLHDPTILACGQIGAGLRVYDIRDPRKPRELAYYNTGTVSAGSTALDLATSRPVVRTDRGEIWFTTFYGGFHVVKFENAVWPFADMSCPPDSQDYYLDQYRPESTCGALGLSSPDRCVSRKVIRLRVRAPRGQRLLSARVYVNGKRVRVLRGRRLRKRVILRGLPGGRVTVKIVARTRRGRTLRSTRTYSACVKEGSTRGR